MTDTRFYGFRAERKSMDAKLARLKKALRRRSVTDLLLTIIDDADKKILAETCATAHEAAEK